MTDSVSTAPDTPQERSVWFYRDYQQLSGGHLKHSHYYKNTLSFPGFKAKIVFEQMERIEAAEISTQKADLWPGAEAKIWQAQTQDLLFIAGTDWRYLEQQGLMDCANPKLNLIQHVRHAHKDSELYTYLKHKAIRICVSQEVADAIQATAIVDGPVIVIPNGVDLNVIVTKPGSDNKGSNRLLIAGYKNPAFAQALAKLLDSKNIDYQLNLEFLERDIYLKQLDEHAIVLCLPHAEEGFYLPALEVMARGKILITMDCVGNRSFCSQHNNCYLADYTLESALDCIQSAMLLKSENRQKIIENALQTAHAFSMQAESKRYHALLQGIDRLWQ